MPSPRGLPLLLLCYSAHVSPRRPPLHQFVHEALCKSVSRVTPPNASFFAFAPVAAASILALCPPPSWYVYLSILSFSPSCVLRRARGDRSWLSSQPLFSLHRPLFVPLSLCYSAQNSIEPPHELQGEENSCVGPVDCSDAPSTFSLHSGSS